MQDNQIFQSEQLYVSSSTRQPSFIIRDVSRLTVELMKRRKLNINLKPKPKAIYLRSILIISFYRTTSFTFQILILFFFISFYVVNRLINKLINIFIQFQKFTYLYQVRSNEFLILFSSC